MACTNPDCDGYLPFEFGRNDIDRLVEHYHLHIRPKVGVWYRNWQRRQTFVRRRCLTRDFLADHEDKLFCRLLRDLKEREEENLWTPLGFSSPPLFSDLVRPYLTLRTRPRLRKEGREKVQAALKNDIFAQQLRELGEDGLRRVLTIYSQGVSAHIGRLLQEAAGAIVADLVCRNISPEHARRAALREAAGLPRGPAPSACTSAPKPLGPATVGSRLTICSAIGAATTKPLDEHRTGQRASERGVAGGVHEDAALPKEKQPEEER